MARETAAPAEGTEIHRPPQDASPLAEMLAREPSRVTRRFLYFLLFVVFVALVGAAVVEIDVPIKAPAVLLPNGKGISIQPEIAGTVVDVRVKEGDAVLAGQTLAVIESEKAGEQLALLAEAGLKLRNAGTTLNVVLPATREQTEEQVKVLKEQIAALMQERTFLTRKREHEQKSLTALRASFEAAKGKLDEGDTRADEDVKATTESLRYRRQSYEINDRLNQQQVVSRLEYLASIRELHEADAAHKKALSQKRERAQERIFAVRTFEREEQQQLHRIAEAAQDLERNDVQSRTAQLSILRLQGDLRLKQLDAETNERSARFEMELARQRADLSRSEQNRLQVREVADGKGKVTARLLVVAPVAGRVGTVQILRQGEAVERGRTLFTIVPDGPLVAEVRIAGRDIALVKYGQEVKLKLDAFPFAEYGSLKGVLTNVPPEAEGLDKPGESFYRATARLEGQEVGKGDRSVPLLSGMTATAEIVVERKTLLAFILTPLLEPFRD